MLTCERFWDIITLWLRQVLWILYAVVVLANHSEAALVVCHTQTSKGHVGPVANLRCPFADFTLFNKRNMTVQLCN